MMVPKVAPVEHVDVTAAMDAAPESRRIRLHVLPAHDEVDMMTASMFSPGAQA
jgi:hypothetical protein